MEVWFLAALMGMIFAGFSNFAFKIAASRKYDSETFNLWGGLISIIFAGVCLVVVKPADVSTPFIIWLTVGSGMIATCGGIMKVYALRYIDTTIFYPLFKLFSPLLAIVAGMVFFSERFSLFEWLGMILGLLVPILLINKIEHNRQTNLVLGLVFVGAISFTSAVAAAISKYSIDSGMSEWNSLWYASVGIFFGSLILLLGKLRIRTFGHIVQHSQSGLVFFAFARSFLICISLLFVLFAYGHGGSLGVVQTIHSMYIIIPIFLSIAMYKEHVDVRKVLAVALSVAALAFLG